ncbi:MAG TPA: tRNA (5-methylaminomethyl-2-thiouridine)(34)-methyltransferase MnmD [Saprospiraceae bacterium]|nr:tRNA (5-methylaminomethyl-2-thiouridine)(34)-methyltransferase MnmD [Saprospiraceae bacterium]
MQDRILVRTKDGSHTVLDLQSGQHYHSLWGAITESRHVFIRSGLETALSEKSNLHILEMGFGTGLNAYLTMLHVANMLVELHYTAIERQPLDPEFCSHLNYPLLCEPEGDSGSFMELHHAPWNVTCPLSTSFYLRKMQVSLESAELPSNFDLVFYDAFAPQYQAGLWSVSIFQKLHGLMVPGAVLTTYCAKGQVKRNMREAGFRLESLPGPPGKREMTRAFKI